MPKNPRLCARPITDDELVDIARCFRQDGEWAAQYTEHETIELLDRELLALAVDVPADSTSTTVYALYLEGCDAPLFAQVRGPGGLYEAGEVQLLRRGGAVPAPKGTPKS